MTGETLTSSRRSAEQLESIRESGLAVEEDEAVLGECSFAAPVFDGMRGVVGAIGVVAPSAAWPRRPGHAGRGPRCRPSRLA